MTDKAEKQLLEVQQYWDREAETFDEEPDHGLKDPAVLATWTDLLESWQPAPPAKILDIGCGTGSLSLILAKLGHRVTGIDLSPKMIAQARKKADKAGLSITFEVMGASTPKFPLDNHSTASCAGMFFGCCRSLQTCSGAGRNCWNRVGESCWLRVSGTRAAAFTLKNFWPHCHLAGTMFQW